MAPRTAPSPAPDQPSRGRHRDLPPSPGRHRAHTASSGRGTARVAIAAVTTGTIATSGAVVAAATSSSDGALTPPSGAATGPMSLQASSPSHSRDVLIGREPIVRSGTALHLDAHPGTLHPGTRVELSVLLREARTRHAVAGQPVRILRAIGPRWVTTAAARTDRAGHARLATRLLVTTRLTAVFDGSKQLRASRSLPETLTVVPLPPPPRPKAPDVGHATTTKATTATASAPARAATNAPTMSATAPSSLGQRAVWLASQQAGKPYQWGAAGPYQFDCSGLVMYVFSQLGRSLPHNAEAQYEASTHVSQFAKQPGDLIFLGQPGSIYHVGIYAGNGQYWAAPHTGAVVHLSPLDTTSYLVGRIG